MIVMNNPEDWMWVNLFDPKTTNSPAIEGGFDQEYRVKEAYIELNDDDTDEDDDDDNEFQELTEEENTQLPVLAESDDNE